MEKNPEKTASDMLEPSSTAMRHAFDTWSDTPSLPHSLPILVTISVSKHCICNFPALFHWIRLRWFVPRREKTSTAEKCVPSSQCRKKISFSCVPRRPPWKNMCSCNRPLCLRILSQGVADQDKVCLVIGLRRDKNNSSFSSR